MAAGKDVRIGIALGEGEAVAVVLGKLGAPTARVRVAPAGDGPETGSRLREAMEALKEAMDRAVGSSTEGAQVWVALLPPVADARLVNLPPMRKSDVEAVLRRDAARYFLGAVGPRTVGVRLPTGPSGAGEAGAGTRPGILAAVASTELLERTRSALESVGWRVRSFSSAHGAWLDVAVGKESTFDAVAAVLGGAVHLIRIQEGDAAAIRQVPAGDTDALLAALGDRPGRLLVLATPQIRDDLGAPLRKAGWTVGADPRGWSAAEEATAARARTEEMELTPPSLARDRRETTRKRALGLIGAAACLVVASLGVQLWGAHRELDAIRGRRAAIRSEVQPLLAARDSLNVLTAQVQSMEELASSVPVWTRSLVELSALLPPQTYLTGLFASGDTVEIEASGTEAGVAIQALREAGLFQEVRLQGLVERELEEGETVTERFRLWALLPAPESGGGVQ